MTGPTDEGGADGPTDEGGVNGPTGEGGGRPSLLLRTLLGVAGGGLLFLGLGVYLNAATDLPLSANLGPLLMLVLVGATVGGLVAPLAAGLLDRWRDREGG